MKSKKYSVIITARKKGLSIMKSISVYDPALCCSTGICGTSVDPALTKFAADLDWLKSHSIVVLRYDLAQQAGAFVENAAVRQLLQEEGETVLPVVVVDGEVKSKSVYPEREKLAEWLSLESSSASPKSSSGSCCGPKGCC